VPFGVLAVVGALRFMPRSRPVRGERLDLSGVALLVLASMLLIFPLVQGRDLGWPRWSLVMMVAALLVLAVFVVQQRRRTSSPLITLSLFGRRAYSAGLLVITLFFASLVGLMLVFGLYLQIGLGFSPLRAGLTFAPWALGIAVASALAGAWLANAFGRRTVHGGLIVLAVGLGWLSLTIHQHGTGTSSVALVPALLVCGLGSGLVLSPLFNIILAAVQDDEVGSGSGVLNAVQQFGGAAGVAVLGTVFFSVLAGHAGAVADAQAPALRAAVTAAAPGAPADPVLATYRACLVDRMHADDPDTIPPSCRPRPATAATTSQTASPTAPGAAEPAAVDSALTAAAGDAVRRDFTHALQVTLMITLATTLLTVLLAFLLPRTARPE
jgi:MFS family permease